MRIWFGDSLISSKLHSRLLFSSIATFDHFPKHLSVSRVDSIHLSFCRIVPLLAMQISWGACHLLNISHVRHPTYPNMSDKWEGSTGMSDKCSTPFHKNMLTEYFRKCKYILEYGRLDILSLVNKNSRTQKFFQNNFKKMEYLNVILILSEFYNYIISKTKKAENLS